MSVQLVRVECYAGYRGNERPVKLYLGGRALGIALVEDRWYSPGETYFRVLTKDGDRYVLRHTEAQDIWSLSAFRGKSSSGTPFG